MIAAARLPVDDVLADLLQALATVGVAVLEAPTGAGKTTRVPLALLHAPWRGDGTIVVLEPRRVAARAAARFMASLLGERVGGTVGYVTRDDRQVSAATRIEVVTEGVLVRRLQRDPSLDGVAAVIFDEFHERSLTADLGLALTLEARAALREDLRLLVMSATLEGARVAELLQGAPVITSAGRQFAVHVEHRDVAVGTAGFRSVVDAVPGTVREALAARAGDVLVFLPGAGEIRRVAGALGGLGPEVLVAPLYGSLPAAEQDRAIDPPPPGVRKVVLATDIAETSLTIEGVRTVVDSGLARSPRFDPRTGMSRLETVRVSRASADQRAGRAGRVAEGSAIRLWSQGEHARLGSFTPPEIAVADLAGFALELAAWGVEDPAALSLLDQPPTAAFGQARDLLRALGALDDGGTITDHGRELADLPTHPRLAHLLVVGLAAGDGALACDLAALLGDRDLLVTDRATPDADLRARVAVLHGATPPPGARVRSGAIRAVSRESKRLRRAVGVPRDAAGDPDRTGRVLAPAYPDRVARRRGRRGTFVLANGRGVQVDERDPLGDEAYLVVAEVDDRGTDGRVWSAAAIDEPDLREVLAARITTTEVVGYEPRTGELVAEAQTRLGVHVLDRAAITPSGAAMVEGLLDAVRRLGLAALPWTRDLSDLRARVAFLHHTIGAPWPDLDDAALLADLEHWLAPFLPGIRRVSQLQRVPLESALHGAIGYDRVRDIDRLAPTHLEVPSGSRVRLDYADPDAPVLAVKLQELFGATTTPTVADGRVQVVVHLLSPARRPVQVTRDLAGFWERGYPEVRAELRGRYPRHPWPEDPTTAVATKRTTRRS